MNGRGYLRNLAAWILALVVVLGCSDSSGPEDASPFIEARFLGKSWTVTAAADLFVELGSDNRLTISGIRRDSRGNPLDAIEIMVRDLQGAGTYSFGTGPTDNSASLSMWFHDPPVGSAFFVAAPPNAGSVTLSIDTVEHRVDGVFSFDGLSVSGSTRVPVTQGRFRLNYQ